MVVGATDCGRLGLSGACGTSWPVSLSKTSGIVSDTTRPLCQSLLNLSIGSAESILSGEILLLGLPEICQKANWYVRIDGKSESKRRFCLRKTIFDFISLLK